VGQIGHELLPNRLQVAKPGYVSRQQNEAAIHKGHGAELQDPAGNGQFNLGRLFKPRLARSERQSIDAMVSNDLNQRPANRLLEEGEHQLRRRVEPPDESPIQDKNPLFYVVDDPGQHWARLGGIDRREGNCR
jgi:hypothetical protein